MKRFVELDLLRGGLLLMMIVDHAPSWLRHFTDQPLGFFSTAECFVFVSAFLAGMLFRKRTEKIGFAAARAATIRRAWRIYGAHVATLAFTFVLGTFFLSEFPGIANRPLPDESVGGNQWFAGAAVLAGRGRPLRVRGGGPLQHRVRRQSSHHGRPRPVHGRLLSRD